MLAGHEIHVPPERRPEVEEIPVGIVICEDQAGLGAGAVFRTAVPPGQRKPEADQEAHESKECTVELIHKPLFTWRDEMVS